MTKKLLIGAHISISKGLDTAVKDAAGLGCTTLQLFTANQRQWSQKTYTKDQIAKYKEALKETNISHVMSHSSYLINLGSGKEDLRNKSKTALKQEIERCHALDITYLTFHPGSATGDISKETCLKNIADALIELAPIIKKGDTKILLETTAGQGNTVGATFEELGFIIKSVKNSEKFNEKFPIGVCLDTCHIFSAGYDIRNQKAWDQTLLEFENKIGLKYLVAMHVNDSKNDLNSKKDRHASLGLGKIGIKCFEIIMQDNRLKYLPKYLETPDGDKNFENEIKMLFKFGETN
jgi:deoxyribonuclease IV